MNQFVRVAILIAWPGVAIGSLLAAPLPRELPLLPLPKEAEEAIRQSEERLERNVQFAAKDMARLKRQGEDTNRLPSPEHIRRAFLTEKIRLFRSYLEPSTGAREYCGVPREQLEKAFRQRLELYQMRLHRGMLDGSVAKEDWVPPNRRPRP